jgi:hypothetical protein
MMYAILTRSQPKTNPFLVCVFDARSALTIVADLAHLGLKELDVVDQDGKRYDLADLARLAAGRGM